MKTGEVGTGPNAHARWCEPCGQYHGVLHVCEHYPEHVKEAVARETKRFRDAIRCFASSLPPWEEC